jgi:hypothetical protein
MRVRSSDFPSRDSLRSSGTPGATTQRAARTPRLINIDNSRLSSLSRSATAMSTHPNRKHAVVLRLISGFSDGVDLSLVINCRKTSAIQLEARQMPVQRAPGTPSSKPSAWQRLPLSGRTTVKIEKPVMRPPLKRLRQNHGHSSEVERCVPLPESWKKPWTAFMYWKKGERISFRVEGLRKGCVYQFRTAQTPIQTVQCAAIDPIDQICALKTTRRGRLLLSEVNGLLIQFLQPPEPPDVRARFDDRETFRTQALQTTSGYGSVFGYGWTGADSAAFIQPCHSPTEELGKSQAALIKRQIVFIERTREGGGAQSEKDKLRRKRLLKRL